MRNRNRRNFLKQTGLLAGAAGALASGAAAPAAAQTGAPAQDRAVRRADRYDDSFIFERKPFTWPGNKTLAVWIVPNGVDRRSVDALYADSAKQPRVMGIPLHPMITGQPLRIKYLERALAYMKPRDKVCFATGSEIVDAYQRATSTQVTRESLPIVSGARCPTAVRP